MKKNIEANYSTSGLVVSFVYDYDEMVDPRGQVISGDYTFHKSIGVSIDDIVTAYVDCTDTADMQACIELRNGNRLLFKCREPEGGTGLAIADGETAITTAFGDAVIGADDHECAEFVINKIINVKNWEFTV